MANVNGTNDLMIDIAAPDGSFLDVPFETIVNYAPDGSFETVEGICDETSWESYYMTPYDSPNGSDSGNSVDNLFSFEEGDFIITDIPNCPHGMNAIEMESSTLAFVGENYLNYDISSTDVLYISAYIKGDICDGDRLCISPMDFEMARSTDINIIKSESYSLVHGLSHFDDFTRISSIVMLPDSIPSVGCRPSIFLFSDESSSKTSNIQIDCVNIISVSDLYSKLYVQSNNLILASIERASEDEVLTVKKVYQPIQELLDTVLPTFFFGDLNASYDKVESLRITSAKIVPNPASINDEITLQAAVEDIDYVLQYAPLFCGTFDCGANVYPSETTQTE